MKKVAVIHNFASGSTSYNGMVQLFNLFKVFGFRFDYYSDGSITKAQLNANYDFGIVFEHKKATDSGTAVGTSLVSYSAGDKPIFYINGQNRTGFPSDFPIIAFNQADNTTFYQHESGLYTGGSNFRIGSCVRDAKGRKCWGVFANYVYPSTPTDYAYYRVDTSKLDNNREVLLWLSPRDMRIADPPSNHAVAVRYYNRYFVPMAGGEPRLFGGVNGWSFRSTITGIPALLYCMTHAGIKPDNQLIAYHEIDHPLGMSGYSGYSGTQILQNLYATMSWLVDNFKHKHLNIVCGITSHHTRNNTWGHVFLYNNYDLAKKIHNLLRDNEGGLFSVCWHDHSYDVGTVGQSYTRHSGGSYGAPVNITDSECNFGTGTTATMNLRSLTPLQVHIEDQIKWLKNYLGFRGAFAEPFYHMNFATNSYGGWYVAKLLKERWGVKSIRVTPFSTNVTTGQGTVYRDNAYGTNIQTLQIDGVEYIGSEDNIISSVTDFAGIDSYYNLGASGNRDTLYRRFMAFRLNTIFNLYLCCSVPYMHESAILDASLANPLARYNETGNFNGWVELFSEIDNLIQFIPDWIKWGNIEELRMLRRKIRSYV